MFLNFLQIESYKKGIVLSSGFNIVAKVLAFATNIAIAYYFGTQAKTDVYFYCMATIMLSAGFFTSVNSAVIIPESMRLTAQEGEKTSMEFINFFFWIHLFIGLAAICILAINPVAIFATISQFDQDKLQTSSNIVLLSIPLFAFILLSNFLIDVLKSYRFFTVPMAASMLNSIISLVFLLCFHNKLGVVSLLMGLIIAYILQLCFMVYLLIKLLRWRFSFKIFPVGSKVLKNIFYSMLGNITTTLSAFVPPYLLSGMGLGIISSLNYGQRVANLPIYLIIGQFSSVVAIKLNELYARKAWEQVNNIFLSSAKILVFMLVPISFIMCVYSNNIITVLFKRGAFNDQSVANSRMFLKYLALLLPMLAVNTLVARLFMAAQKIKQAFWYQIVINVFLIGVVLACVKSLGPIGYPVGLVLLNFCNTLLLYYLLGYFFPFVNYKGVLSYMARIILLNVVICLVVILLKSAIDDFSLILSLISGVIFYGIVLFVLNAKFHINLDFHDIVLRCIAVFSLKRNLIKTLTEK